MNSTLSVNKYRMVYTRNNATVSNMDLLLQAFNLQAMVNVRIQSLNHSADNLMMLYKDAKRKRQLTDTVKAAFKVKYNRLLRKIERYTILLNKVEAEITRLHNLVNANNALAKVS